MSFVVKGAELVCASALSTVLLRAISLVLEDLNTRSLAGRSLVCLQNCKVEERDASDTHFLLAHWRGQQVLKSTLLEGLVVGVRAGVAMLAALPGLVLATSKFVYRLRLALTAAADSMRGAVPDSFRCPITQDVMVHPVIVTETGHSYERFAIEQWLRTHNRDPKTNVQLRSKNLIPNHSLRASTQEFAANNGAGLSP